jgi:hypothetical protein
MKKRSQALEVSNVLTSGSPPFNLSTVAPETAKLSSSSWISSCFNVLHNVSGKVDPETQPRGFSLRIFMF